jgi:ubiquinone/menaquinone biosynthesis C-methylase UbiE
MAFLAKDSPRRISIVTNITNKLTLIQDVPMLRGWGRQAHSPVSGPRVVSVTEGYELWAPRYDCDPNPLLLLEERTLDGQLPSLAEKDVLDIGCGTGRWLQRFLELGARSATGVDLSAGMLAAARQKPHVQGRLVRGDCAALPFRSRSADFVMCSFVMGHLPELRAFASEIARVAKARADCYVTDVCPAAHGRGWRTGFRHETGSAEIATFGHSLGHILESITAAGFALTRWFEVRLGEPERPIFARAGKEYLFEEARALPALLVCHFTRLHSQGTAS